MREIYVDTKCTVWHREFFTVEDDMTNEEFTKEYNKGELINNNSEYLFETSEDISLSENDNQTTIEMFDETTSDPFYDNAEKERGITINTIDDTPNKNITNEPPHNIDG